MLSEKSKKYLLAIARQTLVDYFNTGIKLTINEKDIIDKEMLKKAATFVTLHKHKNLRGCIGSIKARNKMYEDVINNALLAAFGDNRFEQLSSSELNEIKIEISVLSEPKPYLSKDYQELLDQIKVDEHGIIIQDGFNQATFLPQVWQDLPDKKEFLSALCQKAGLEKNSWREENTELFYYTVEKFSE